MNQDKLSIELPDQPRSHMHWPGRTGFDYTVLMTDFFDLAAYQIRNFAQRASEVAEHAHKFRIPPEIDENVLKEVARRQNSCNLGMSDLLSKHHFLKQLRLEKRRTDRSRAPLSMVLFHSGKKGDELDNVKGLLELLRNSKREIDVLGYLSEDLIALLLLDTSKEGAQEFMRKIKNRVSDLQYSIITGTYPDQLFDCLLMEHRDLPNSYPFFLDDPTEPTQFGCLLKRSLDIVGSMIGILLFSPLMLTIGILIKATSPGPVIFKQSRLGKRGVLFVFYKFRSMSLNVDDRIHREYVTSLIKGHHAAINQGDTAKPLYKIKSDPRVTRVGRVIRKTSMDELPQLFNVLMGEMSLVGPRPPIPYEAEKYEPWHLRRILEIKPGITGLWQVEGRSKTSFDDMVRLDLRYIRNCSLILDLKILIKTVMVVLRCDGAS